MKRIHPMIVAALVILGARDAGADTLTSGNGGQTVIDTVTTAAYGTITITWAADANIAGGLSHDSPYWVDGINPDGSMSLSTAVAFINQLNRSDNPYLGITTWRLPTTVQSDSSCSITLDTGNIGYNCGMHLGKDGTPNPAYPYSELATLFYEGLGGSMSNNILLVHNSAFTLFKHFQPYLYWSESAQSQPANPQFGYDFWFQNGFEGTENAYDSMFVLPVSTTSNGPFPATVQACAAIIPNNCPGDLLPDLGLTTTLSPAKFTLRVNFDGTLIYDPTLGVSFLANANLAGTLSPDSPYWVDGINPDGSMNTTTLTKFLAALNNPANPYLGITGWTIPTIAADGENPDCTIPAPYGDASYGYNCDGTASQLGELFYDQLGGVAGQSPQFVLPHLGPPLFFQLFNHLELNYYWQCHPLSTDLPGQCEPGNSNGHPPSFSFLTGYQGVQSDPNELFVILEVPGYLFVDHHHHPPGPFF